MTGMNLNYMKVKESYLFADIRRRIEEWQKENPGKKVLRLGIGGNGELLREEEVTGVAVRHVYDLVFFTFAFYVFNQYDFHCISSFRGYWSK